MLLPPADGLMTPGSCEGVVAPSLPALLLFLPAMLLLSILVVWGTACILLVGKRLVQSKAGRARTSFATVRKDAATYVLPLLLTGILRACFTFFWMLPGLIILFIEILLLLPERIGVPLITTDSSGMWTLMLLISTTGLGVIPSIIYSIRTVFYEVVVVGENKYYRGALQKSKQVVLGHTWRVLFYIVGLSVVLFFPPTVVGGLFETLIVTLEPRFVAASDVVSAALTSGVTLLFLLANMSLYGALKKARPQHVEG